MSKAKQVQRRRLSLADKRRAVTLYAHGASHAEIAREFGISRSSVGNWVASKWWQPMVEDVVASIDQDNVRQLQKVHDKAVKITLQRLEQGDPVLDKHGEIHHLPVKARDASRIAADALDRVNRFRGHQAVQSDALNLTELAKAFAQIGAEAAQSASQPPPLAGKAERVG